MAGICAFLDGRTVTSIHLVRHGQTEWNLERRVQGHTESYLTAEGQDQARQVARQLQSISFDAAYSSSSIRAVDTARHILHYHSLSLNTRDDLREIYLGSWEGRLHDELKEAYPEEHRIYWDDPSQFEFSGAETFHQLQARAVSAIEDIASKHQGETVLVVSHGLFIKVVLSHYEGRHLRELWQPPRMGNCCHSIIQRKGDSFEIVQYAGLSEW